MPFVITTRPEELKYGLFGHIFLSTFEILPYLDENKFFPAWNVRSVYYGLAPGYTVIPGLLDLNYSPPPVEGLPERRFFDVRHDHVHNLGGDWHGISRLWGKYFRFPDRIYESAKAYGDLTGALGLHYRGTDKNTDLVATNLVTKKDFFALADDFLSSHREVKKIFIATDEPQFLDDAKERYREYTIVQTGQATFWKNSEGGCDLLKGDHAVLDCLLLSRCSYLIKCSSALSGFAKVLNPGIQAYRVSANKLFYYDIPYFPDSYIDPYPAKGLRARLIMRRLMKDDWRQNRAAFAKYGKPFCSSLREESQRHIIPPFPSLKPPLRDRVIGKARRIAKKLLVWK